MIKINKNIILELILIIIPIFTLFVPSIKILKNIMAIILLIYAVLVTTLVKKRDKVISYKRQIILQMVAFGIIYILIYYLLGIYFGFYKNYSTFDLSRITDYIIPITIIIISSEILRYELINKKEKHSQILVYIAMVLIDIIIYGQSYDITKLSDFLAIIGLISFVSMSCNLLYNYITTRFGYKPIIIYKLITTLSLYIIPVLPNVYTFLITALRIIYPYIIYLFLEYIYKKNKQNESYVSKSKKIINTIIVCIVAILITMIISCKFYVGIIAVGSESMTGAINKGDAVVFVKYTNQEIDEGDVIIFAKDNNTIIHRIIKKVEINGETRYYTKGDVNEDKDEGYITDSDIFGISKFRIRYIGYPTIWISNLFS